MAHYKGAADEANRAMQLQKKREMAKEEMELKKKKIEEDLKLSTLGNKFATHYDAIEAHIKSQTVGLVTLDQMKEKHEMAVREREKQLAQQNADKRIKQTEIKKELLEKRRKQTQVLSFKFDEDDEEGDSDEEDDSKEEEEDKQQQTVKIPGASSADSDSNSASETRFGPKKKRKMLKNPDVDTSFLPDREREEEEMRLREELRLKWQERQEKLKEEEIEITFSYWDGSGHRRTVKMKKGHSIYQFLQRCMEVLRKEFNELRSITADQLMYVKEDLIIPHHYTFYDFIVTKARGKSGPLFSFDVHDDVRLKADASVEKDESHAGKVLLRSWYERNKHIFPASRWESYDPTKTYDKYTISDKKSR